MDVCSSTRNASPREECVGSERDRVAGVKRTCPKEWRKEEDQVRIGRKLRPGMKASEEVGSNDRSRGRQRLKLGWSLEKESKGAAAGGGASRSKNEGRRARERGVVPSVRRSGGVCNSGCVEGGESERARARS
jgi:hypothetical protein